MHIGTYPERLPGTSVRAPISIINCHEYPDFITMSFSTPPDTAFGNGRAVIFDLDGTLVDTAPDLATALNHALVSDRRKPVSIDRIRPLIGEGAEKLVRHALIDSLPDSLTDSHPSSLPDSLSPSPLGSIAVSATHIRHLTTQLLAYYRAHLVADSVLYPGMRDVLNRLRDQGYTLCVATNKPEEMAKEIIRMLDLSSYFYRVQGYRDDFLRKPDPAFLLRACRLAGLAPENCTMVGDSIYDSVAARLAGMDRVILNHGYGPFAAKEEEPRLDDVRQLPQWLAERRVRVIDKTIAP